MVDPGLIDLRSFSKNKKISIAIIAMIETITTTTIAIINLMYIAQIDTNAIPTALFIVIITVNTNALYVCTHMNSRFLFPLCFLTASLA